MYVSSNIRDVLIFERRTNSQIQQSSENYYYISATKKKWKLGNFKLREKSQNQEFAIIETRVNYQIYIQMYKNVSVHVYYVTQCYM